MITLVLGGSGSGKSAYAEHLLDGKTNKYYIATMQVYDAEGGKKVARHRRLRAGSSAVVIDSTLPSSSLRKNSCTTFFALIIPILIVPAQSVKLSFQLHMVKIVLAQCLIKHNGNRIR